MELIMNVPLRKEWLKVPRTRRAKKAVNALRSFIAKRSRVELDQVKIGNHVNELIWQRGIQKPPHHVKVKVKKITHEDKVFVLVETPEYFDAFVKTIIKEEKESKPKEEKTTEENEKPTEEINQETKEE